jgi:hypothetical protein
VRSDYQRNRDTADCPAAAHALALAHGRGRPPGLALALPWAVVVTGDGRSLVFLFTGGSVISKSALTLGMSSLTSFSLLLLARFAGDRGMDVRPMLISAGFINLMLLAAMFVLWTDDLCRAGLCTSARLSPHAGWFSLMLANHLVAAGFALAWTQPPPPDRRA